MLMLAVLQTMLPDKCMLFPSMKILPHILCSRTYLNKSILVGCFAWLVSCILCIFCIFTIFDIYCVFMNSINGLVSTIPHVIAAQRVFWKNSGQICHLLQRLCVPGKQKSPSKREVMDCWKEEPEVWLKELLWSGTKMDQICAPAPICPCMNWLGNNVEPT
jgi:hypothetical protein